MYCVALAMEYSTPLAPRLFLPLASLANIGKNVGLATYVATQVGAADGVRSTSNCGIRMGLTLGHDSHANLAPPCFQPAFHRSFARGNNLADISAKSQARRLV